MADEDDLPAPPAPPPEPERTSGRVPFTGPVDWDSELAAWDAQFPFTTPPRPAAELPAPVARTKGASPGGEVVDETGSILIIPDVEALEAGAGTPPPQVQPPTAPPPPPSPPTARGRSLIDDGLPEISGVYTEAEALGEPVDDEPADDGLYTGPLPPERAGRLELPAAPAASPWDPAALLGGLSATEKRAALELATTYWRDQAALYGDELAAREGAPLGEASVEESCRLAVAAARAQERGGNSEAALRAYDEALEADPSYRPALRGRFRLLERTESWGDARAALAALAGGGGDEAAAYGALLAEWDQVHPESRPLQRLRPRRGAAEPPESASSLIVSVERALADGDRRRAATALTSLGERLGGEAGAALTRAAALVAEVGGDLERARALRGTNDSGVLAALAVVRTAARADRGVELAQLVEAAERGAPPALAAAILRWAARLGRGLGDVARARTLLSRAESAAPGSLLPAERDELAMSTLGPEPGDVEALAALTPAQSAAVAARWAESLIADGRAGEALPIIEAALARAPEHPLLARVAERAALGMPDPILAEAALRLWAQGDPARAPLAKLRIAEGRLAVSPLAPDALDALREACDASPEDGSFWELSWRLAQAGRAAEAAEALTVGARAWDRAGADQVATALRERAAELRLAALPGDLVARLPANRAHSDNADHPARLTRAMLDPELDAREIADAFKSAATEGAVARVYEAAGWLIHAGALREALGWVTDAAPHGPEQVTAALLVRRLVRSTSDPAQRALLLGELLEGTLAPDERAEVELYRAEALELAGRRAEAAAAYRELLAGPLARDADLALRRVLWLLKDAEALQAVARDEHDALVGAGRMTAAALTLAEKSRVLADLLGDVAGAEAARVEALAHHPGMRGVRLSSLLHAAVSRDRPALVERLGALADDAAAWAPSLMFLAALLAEGAGDSGAAERLLREAMRREEAEAPLALVRRHVAAEENHSPPDPGLGARLETRAERIAATPGADPRLGTYLFVRAAEIEAAHGRPDRAEALLGRALALEPEHLPALVARRRLLLARGAHQDALEVLVAEARALRRPAHKGAALLTAAVIAQDRLGDPARARTLLAESLAADPAGTPAFARLRQLLGRSGTRADSAALAELLANRANVAQPEEAAHLRLERADLLLGPLADRAAAKEELRTLLTADPQHVGALARLARLELEDGAHAVAAELSIRQARFERDQAALLDCFLRIGRLYTRPLSDAKVAIGAFERVLRLEPDNREALETLSELHTRQSDVRKALAATDRLLEIESDKTKRLPFLIRLGSLWERAGDVRRASSAFRRAVEESPRSLQAVGELARHFERHRELQARNVLLDGTLALLREDVRARPDDLETLRSMIPVLRWRQRPAGANAVTQLLARLSPDPAEQKEAQTRAPARDRRLASLANPDLAERALPESLPAGIRNVMRLLGPALSRVSKPDLRAWGVSRGDRQGIGTPLRDAVTPLAADLGVRAVDLYVSDQHPRALVVEPGEPPALIVGRELVALGTPAVRFMAGFALRLIETRFDHLAAGGPLAPAAVLTAAIRQSSPDHITPGVTEEAVVTAQSRVSRAWSKALRTELGPFLGEIAGTFAAGPLADAVSDTAVRAGLLACGDLGMALAVLCRMSNVPFTPRALAELPAAGRLLDFATSDDHEELVQALESEASSG